MMPKSISPMIQFALVLVVLSGVAVPQNTPLDPSNPQDVVRFLNQTLAWYRHLAVDQEIATEPNELLFVNDNRDLANQVVRLSFEFARAEEGVSEKAATPNQNNEQQASLRSPLMTQTAAKLDNEANQARQELAALRQKLETANGRQRADLQAAIAASQSELDLIDARREVVHSLMEFMAGTNSSESGGLAAQIDALAHSLPPELTRGVGASANGTSANNSSLPVSVSTARKSAASGLWGLVADLFAVSRKVHTLDETIRLTDSLAQSSKQLQTPLVSTLREMAKQSDAMVNQPDPSDKSLLVQQKKTFDSLTAQFKLVSACFLPLSKQAILLGLYRGNLNNWRGMIKNQRDDDLKSLMLRLGSLGLVIAIILAVAELWRRAIFRYVHEVRRRYQFLLLRRIVLWFAIMLVIAFAFASELGSVATFAGLLTAGVAVALQNVILSIAGYFFLIGRFGVRIGDRVQISGVSGEVVEIGLVRLHVMELAGTGSDVQPTGRVVAFSNSFVFQPAAGVFKQIPGTSFVWHEITLTLASESSYQTVEERVRKAVDSAFAGYNVDLEQQRLQMERSLGSISVGTLRPRIRFRLTPAGLEVTVQFPVQLHKAAEVDEQVTRELLRAIEQEPQLNVVGSDIPTIKAASSSSDPKAKAS
jgi:small-conductance mechanosensitive channel